MNSGFTMICLIKKRLLVFVLLLIAGCHSETSMKDERQTISTTDSETSSSVAPAEIIDLSHWKLTLPLDEDNDGKVDEIGSEDLRTYIHPDFFYGEGDYVTFTAPNLAATTANSTNTRSELRQLLNPSAKSTKSPSNNFALANHDRAAEFGSIGGRLSAKLKVNHVAVSAEHPAKPPAYSVVVGQIHAGKDKALLGKGFGWGNEPLKIYYKKWPSHEMGSVFWTYERNLPKNDPNRTDIAYPVWGNTWKSDADPRESGVALGEVFRYTVEVEGNTMHLTFESNRHEMVEYQIDLSNNVDANGEIDKKDHPLGYTGDWMYFKAGAYNQCSVQDKEGMWYPGCTGSGKWSEDKHEGHYASVSFYEISVE